jgi:hypothetical protein
MASNLPLLEEAAKLKHLLPEVVFVGGSTLDLIVTDQGSAPGSAQQQDGLCRRLAWSARCAALYEQPRGPGSCAGA